MMMEVGGWVGWGGWVVCIELWPRAMQNAIHMATLCCWARFDITTGCVAPWPGHHLALWCLPDCHWGTAVGCALLSTSQGKQLARPPMPSCHQGTTKLGVLACPVCFGHLGAGPPCQAATCNPRKNGAGLPSLFSQLGASQHP